MSCDTGEFIFYLEWVKIKTQELFTRVILPQMCVILSHLGKYFPFY